MNLTENTRLDWTVAPKDSTHVVSDCWGRTAVPTKTGSYSLVGLEFEAGTTGAKGGNTTHGARTYLRLEVREDKMEGGLPHLEFRVVHDKLEIVLGGDWEIDAIKSALRHMLRTLEEQTAPEEVAALPLDEGGLLRELEVAFESVNKGRSKPVYEQTDEVRRAFLPRVTNCDLCGQPAAHVRMVKISPEVSHVCGATKGLVYFRPVGLCSSCEQKDYKTLIEQKKFSQEGRVATTTLQ